MMKLRTNCLNLFILLVTLLIFSNSCKKNDNNPALDGTVIDINGNVYTTIAIGTQVWMVENLKVTKYRNGDPIPNVTNDIQWGKLTSGAYCEYNNKTEYGTKYGKLYNWYAVNDSRNIAPIGWRVSTDTDWIIMENYLIVNGYNYDGSVDGNWETNNKLAKSLAATSYWAPNKNSGSIGSLDYPDKSNATGFTALPGGSRFYDGFFEYFGGMGYWWTSKEYNTRNALYKSMYSGNHDIICDNFDKKFGFSVRCVKD